jgi:predicted ribosome quality control (RQC) complex YloA/Tae2 family protein
MSRRALGGRPGKFQETLLTRENIENIFKENLLSTKQQESLLKKLNSKRKYDEKDDEKYVMESELKRMQQQINDLLNMQKSDDCDNLNLNRKSLLDNEAEREIEMIEPIEIEERSEKDHMSQELRKTQQEIAELKQLLSKQNWFLTIVGEVNWKLL